MGGSRVLGIEHIEARIVEPFRSDDRPEVAYRLTRSPRLDRSVVDRLSGALLQLDEDGWLLLRPQVDGSPTEPLPGRWWRAGEMICLTAAVQSLLGDWESFDGLIENRGETEFLHCVYADGSRATIAHVQAGLAVPTGEPVAEMPWPGGLDGAGEGLPNSQPATALDVDWPVYDLTFCPSDGFPNNCPQRAVLHLNRADPDDPDRFSMSLLCVDGGTDDGVGRWSREDLSRSRDTAGPRRSCADAGPNPGKCRCGASTACRSSSRRPSSLSTSTR